MKDAGDELLDVLEVAHANLDQRDHDRELAAIGETDPTPVDAVTPTRLLLAALEHPSAARSRRHLRAVP